MPNTLNIGDYIGLLIQVPLVGIFIYFTLKLINIFMAAQAEFLKTLQQQNEKWEHATKQRDEQWQTFLREQRDTTNEAMVSLAARLGDEIKNIAQVVARLEGMMLEHDSQSRNQKPR